MGIRNFNISESTLVERDSERFLDNVAKDGILEGWHRGHYSDRELLERLAYLKLGVEQTTEEVVLEELRSS